ELGQDLEVIVDSRPALDDAEGVMRWAEAIEIESRKVQAALLRHGVHPYDAVISSPYNPALHERVGSKRVEGMGPLLIAEGHERGDRDFGRYLRIALGSNAELRTQTYIAARIGMLDKPTMNEIVNETREISRMLYALKRSLIHGTPQQRPQPSSLKTEN